MAKRLTYPKELFVQRIDDKNDHYFMAEEIAERVLNVDGIENVVGECVGVYRLSHLVRIESRTEVHKL